MRGYWIRATVERGVGEFELDRGVVARRIVRLQVIYSSSICSLSWHDESESKRLLMYINAETTDKVALCAARKRQDSAFFHVFIQHQA